MYREPPENEHPAASCLLTRQANSHRPSGSLLHWLITLPAFTMWTNQNTASYLLKHVDKYETRKCFVFFCFSPLHKLSTQNPSSTSHLRYSRCQIWHQLSCAEHDQQQGRELLTLLKFITVAVFKALCLKWSQGCRVFKTYSKPFQMPVAYKQEVSVGVDSNVILDINAMFVSCGHFPSVSPSVPLYSIVQMGGARLIGLIQPGYTK